ncbi:alpha/beta hydrolase [Mesobacillus subterraneus]|uniref:alpha/beta hydrolase family protein n=1 Tax=Mesobacillus subterraneus TaxID=285983 RepID=UPI00203D43CB|nr:alpha/beta hydrolase [Mesobacillus subterraneus]MCM3575343.1 alpha/beta hydrolase [Mesobacillus subterraneus]
MSNKFNISYGEHQSQFGVLRLPESSDPCPVIVLIHGGFWQSKYNIEENTPIAEDLTRRGYATWNIEYRRLGEELEGWNSIFNDVIAAINHFSIIKDSYHIDLSNVTVIGHSAGGHLALWLASRINASKTDGVFDEIAIPIQKILSLAGVTDLKNMWEIHEQKGINSPVAALLGGAPQEVPNRYKMSSPIELLPFEVEQVLIHGELDRHVPVDLSKNYFQRALEKGDKVKLVVLPDIEHFKIIDPSSSAWDIVVDLI